MNVAPRTVRADDVPPEPWKNGGGTTRTLLAWPSRDAWSVRISVADIERDGPFSPFPGVARWFAVLKGAGVALDFAGGRTRELRRTDAPFAFDGAAAPGCRLLDGPTRDLNLMLRGADGRLELVEDGARWSPQAAGCGLFTAVGGRCAYGADAASADAAGTVDLPPYTLLWFDAAPPSLAFTAAARPAAATGWWIAATPHRTHTDGDGA